MAGAADELMLLERVFLRLGSAETDEQLQNVLCKFLPPVLLKLSSSQEGVRKKVMELLIHVNRRIKTRPLVQLPVEALLTQYQDPSATSFVTNFTIIYIKTGFPRLPIEKQAELVPTILNSLENKPVSHMDSLLLLIIPLLGKVKVPTDPAKIGSLFGLNEKPHIVKNLLEMLLDMLLLPYGALTYQAEGSNTDVNLPVPPGMSQVSFKRITLNNPIKPEQLEEMKLGIVKFVSHGVFNNDDILIHLIVAAADTRFSVANLADNELKKIVGSASGTKCSLQLQVLFLGSQVKTIKPELSKSPASTRIRLKILTYLVRFTGDVFFFGGCLPVIFDSLYGKNTNSRLKTLALNYATNVVRYGTEELLSPVAPVLLSGLTKQIKEGEESHQGQSYVLIGLLAHRFPKTVYTNVGLLEMFFANLETANPDLRLLIREGLLNLILAYKYDVGAGERDQENRLDIIFALMKHKLTSDEPMVRFVGVKTLATIFPPDHVPSKYLLLLSTGDVKDDVSQEAFKALYGTSRKTDIDVSRKAEKTISMPKFEDIAKYVHGEAEINLKEKGRSFNVGNHVLPFSSATFNEILLYVRLCLLRDLEVPLTREVLRHPCEFSPVIGAHLQSLTNGNSTVENTPLLQYAALLRQYLVAQPSIDPLCCMAELVGCVPILHKILLKDLPWLRDLLSNTKEEVRELAALLYGLVLSGCASDSEFDAALRSLLTQTGHKMLENQHGSLLAIGAALNSKIFEKNRNVKDWDLLKECVNKLIEFLKHSNSLLASAACTSLGCIGRVVALPLPDGKPEKLGSPDAKRLANDGSITKVDVVNSLSEIANNTKMSTKTREKAATSLGLLCVGEKFPHAKEVMEGFLNQAKETKDVEVHFTVGESLVMCCQSVWSPEARNPWSTLPKDHAPSVNDRVNEPLPDDNLEWLLDELLAMAKKPHPNSRQASCIWLLAVIKSSGEKDAIGNRLTPIQRTFMDLLTENNDIVQDTASKGLCVVYDTYKEQELLTALVKQLTSGITSVTKVTSDTKLFEEGQLGSAPSGGNLTTYKELCSLASDLNKPDLIYKFMHLANHNAIWNSKKGAAFGFSSIAERCGEDLKPHLPQIIPKLYRYQFDPTPSIQASMHNIWRVLVTEPSKTLDTYYNEILVDLLENINSNQYRVRQSCCLALQDFLKGSNNRSIHDAVGSMDDLWKKLFRVMDDHHEATRATATKTTRVLSKLCIRGCDISQGKDGVKMVEAILPPLLNYGITNTVADIRAISLQTVSELVTSAGKQLKPFLPKLIPPLLQAAGENESVKLSYLSTMLGAQSQAQEAVDSARASFAKSHFTTETVAKSLQYADASILEELVPKLVELMRGSVGLGTRVACCHFIVLLLVQMGKDMQPYTGKILAVLVNGLTDRNAESRKQYATAIGHLVSSAKDSSLEKLFAKLKLWYFEREDDSIRSACAYTIQSIGIHNQEILKEHSDVVLPLVFFAMHAEKTPETQNTLNVWTEIWSEQSPGTETGIRQNIENICEILKSGLESPSWTMKAQAANSVSTVASKLGTTMDPKHRNALLQILLIGLPGRTWTGKDKLLKALASICSNCKDSIKEDPEVNVDAIVEAVLKESRKDDIVYKNSALQSLADVISSLEVDKFDQVYEIVQGVIRGGAARDEDDDSSSQEVSKHRENVIKIKETGYETLGKTWPANSRQTQEKYREMFVEHSVQCLPTITRSVQVSVMSALYNFIDKLILLTDEELSEEDAASLGKIIDNVVRAIEYSLGISKHTRLRKESLNVVFCLGQKLQQKKKPAEFEKLSSMFRKVLPEIENDTQPEIKSRLNDIKKIFAE
ncbi:unnamed protein product [Brassicogethes aeneus]|uniref:Proteasome-associated protein ECM29 homolog n=1 Tax=Brassicogethes aeneus TaxID=1431903 RepID=A0A9P0B754_BRAAE|nr:unnamed protein product [Brassicogethes aeneus]